jgi:fructose/tagatose bisphosphate aldolase
MIFETSDELARRLEGAAKFENDALQVIAPSAFRGDLTDDLVETAVFAKDKLVKARARFVIRAAAAAAGVHPASIHDLYSAMGRQEISGITVPAMNIRGLSYDTARAFYRAANKLDCGAFIFEIARTEMNYTSQRPAEYVAVMAAAALREGFAGPLFIQGDHFQASAKGFAADPAKEIAGLKKSIDEAVASGFYNIDIDSSTLVNLEKTDIKAQQRDNAEVCAALTRYIREVEPKGVTISVGGEIGEVGAHNSTVEEFRAFMAQYTTLYGQDDGVSKISVQTGTSHGGVVLPDGSVAKVKLDFNVLSSISAVARKEYGLGGTVQHGASTLPDEAFHQFPAHGACEVHLATGFQNLVYEHERLPKEFKQRVYAHLEKAFAGERKEGETPEQFYYKTRKKGFGGELKREWWGLSKEIREAIGLDLEKKFAFLIEQLNVKDSRATVARYVKPRPQKASMDAELAMI